MKLPAAPFFDQIRVPPSSFFSITCYLSFDTQLKLEEIEQYGDQHGNQMRKTVEYGNPVQHTGKQGTGHGRIAPGTIDAGLAGQQHGQLCRSGSSGSLSSEDDGQCGRRKKELKDKMKEKLPRGHKDEQNYGTQTTTPAGGYGYGGREHHEKKGVVEKIKKRRPLDDITMEASPKPKEKRACPSLSVSITIAKD
ncbi:Dehydrin [Forsythia ovata]|uniref:Dehydrin n=1 Tax=Forsythia ovata TaxID=205694 RepID=A0ABD1U7A5_9LAMI